MGLKIRGVFSQRRQMTDGRLERYNKRSRSSIDGTLFRIAPYRSKHIVPRQLLLRPNLPRRADLDDRPREVSDGASDRAG